MSSLLVTGCAILNGDVSYSDPKAWSTTTLKSHLWISLNSLNQAQKVREHFCLCLHMPPSFPCADISKTVTHQTLTLNITWPISNCHQEKLAARLTHSASAHSFSLTRALLLRFRLLFPVSTRSAVPKRLMHFLLALKYWLLHLLISFLYLQFIKLVFPTALSSPTTDAKISYGYIHTITFLDKSCVT